MNLHLPSRHENVIGSRRGFLKRKRTTAGPRTRQVRCEPLEVRNLLSANPISRQAFMVAGDATPIVQTETHDHTSNAAAAAVASQLNAAVGEQVRIRLVTTDLQGNEITTVDVDGEFQLRAFIEDIRAEPQGPFSGHLDVTYTTGLASVDGLITHGPQFPSDQKGDLSTVGLIDEIGATGTSTPPGAGEHLLFTLPFSADTAGFMTFTPDPADVAGHHVLVHGDNQAIDPSDVEYVGTSIFIGPPPTLSVTDVQNTEGNGDRTLDFVVTLSEVVDHEVTVEVATSDGTATFGFGNDYLSEVQTLTFAPGQTTKTIPVRILGDQVIEIDETVIFTLSNPVGAEIANGQATGTILDDDFPTLSIDDVSMPEGTSTTETTEFTFTVTLSEASPREIMVDFTTNIGTAVAPDDYAATNGTLTFAPNELTQTITVEVVADDMSEDDETFTVTLSDPVGATIADNEGVGTIEDDDTLLISIDDVTMLEGTSTTESTMFIFTVTLSAASDTEVMVDFATMDGTAIAGDDYTAANGTLTFAPNETVKTITVDVMADDMPEDDETFTVMLSNAVGATIDDNEGIGTILDDDTPLLSIDNVSMPEGTTTSGTTPFTFTVLLSTASTETVEVNFATMDDTAIATQDYTAANGTLTFLPGETEKEIIIDVFPDATPEFDDAFFVQLSDPVNARIAVNQGLGIGTIEDDDTIIPELSIDDITVDEDDGTATFTVTVTNPNTEAIMVDFNTVDGTATAGEDYEAISGTLTIPAGMTTGSITVNLTDDQLDEDDETFLINLVNPINAILTNDEATATITDNEDLPMLGFAAEASMRDVEMPEGDTGTKDFIFTVFLSEVSGRTVTFDFEVNGLNATENEDFIVPTTLEGTINPGETQTTIVIPVIGDFVPEDDETFDVTLTNAENATIIVNQDFAFGDILDDDTGDPTLSIDDVEVTEGDSGTVNAVFTVTLSAAFTEEVTVDFATLDVTATAGVDYQSTTGTLTFALDETTKTITVVVNGDLATENDETFTVRLSNSTGAGIADADGTGTILDDDTQPTISIDNVTVTEGDGVDVDAVFTVTLDRASDEEVTVDFSTADDTATENSDYRPRNGTLTFAPGETEMQITVPVIGDFLNEQTETFFVNLSMPMGATLADMQGVGTINDPGELNTSSISGFVWVDVNSDNQRGLLEQGLAGVTIRLTGTDEFGNATNRVTTTGADGSYRFDAVFSGNYTITQTQPTRFNDGAEVVGNLGGTAGVDQFFLELGRNQQGANYDFGELGLKPEFIGRHLFFVP